MANSQSRYRWGLLSTGSKALNECEKHLQWEDFDHTQTLAIADSGSTVICYQEKTGDFVVLKSCTESDYSTSRKKLVEMARSDEENALFLLTKCVFNYNDNVYVGSELSDMSLADIIECSIALEEKHLSTILNQVARALQYFHSKTRESGTHLIYGSVQASNVFITRSGRVQLASFGSNIFPEPLTKENCNKDRRDFGTLAHHMISHYADKPSHNSIKLLLPSSGKKLEFRVEPSPQLVDLLDACFSESGNLEKLLKNPFMRMGHPGSLARLVHNGEREMARVCYEEAAA